MADTKTITPIKSFRTTVELPGSKSLTNRALLLAALADGESILSRVLVADDSKRMLESLEILGFQVRFNETTRQATIQGKAGSIPADQGNLFIGNAGTAIRFLTAACCLGQGTYELDGIERMRERPIGELVAPLRELGIDITCLMNEGYPPLQIKGNSWRGNSITMPSTLSSQYISALLQIGALMPDGLTINFTGPLTSQPYIEMTLGLMDLFGVRAEVAPGFSAITIKPGTYQGTQYHIEPDASAATYFLGAAAIVPGSKCTVEGLGFKSLQGDVSFAERVLQPMGCGVIYEPDAVTVLAPPEGEKLRAIDVDLNSMPDTALTLATIALFADDTTIIRNIGNLRVKETDRLAALETELTKLGADVEIDEDALIITPPESGQITPAAIDTYDDHRMAMSFAIAGLAQPGVRINDPACVNKTFPEFFDFLERLGADELIA
jgi:3-phosphoshikimate 1-carboxyvinyltransferase